MMRNKVVLWFVILTIALMGVNACALPIHFSDGPRTIKVIEATEALGIPEAEEAPEEEADEAEDESEDEAEDEPEDEAGEEPEDEAEEETGEEEAEEEALDDDAIRVQDFHLLSMLDDGSYLIFADGAAMYADNEYYAVTEAEMRDILMQLDEETVDALPDYEDRKTLALKSKGADVKEMQSALVAEGYLAGGADGSFGKKSQAAVAAFQEAMGLEATGEADPLLQLLILSAQEESVSILSKYDPLMRFAPIVDKSGANLATAAELGLELDYDDISGAGTLSNDAIIEIDGSGASDIDSYAFTLQFMLKVVQSAQDVVNVVPAVEINCLCVRRPIMQEITLKSGDMRCTLPITDLKNELSGVMSVETATAALDENAVQLLLNAAEAGELKVRIGCKYGTFDGEVEAEQLEAVSDIGKAAAGL
ncbi:MAG: peptidoglycan-binding protein [Clostridia bacterium]|nr:peptidoglycan-binding protein [Clostridia bacterium]